jgi:transposase
VERPAGQTPSYETLLVQNEDLRMLVAHFGQQVVELQEKLAAAQEKLGAAQAEIERLKRQGKRQATPFSKGERVAKPKKPGRRRGQGRFTYRQAPAPEAYTREVEVPLTQTECTACGGVVVAAGVETATVSDLPPKVNPEVTAYHLQLGCCDDCGRRVCATHPEIPADQRGASAHRIGPRALALAHFLHYGLGVPVRKVPAVLAEVYGFAVTQGALTQDAIRRARRQVGKAYRALREQIAREPAVGTDDTGWKVGGAVAFLMGFFSRWTSVFQIRARHRNEEVREVIPGDYSGTLSTDRGRSYDARELEGVKQQKCMSHIQRSLSDALEGRRGRGRSFCLRLKKLLREAMALWEAYHTGTAPDFATERERIGWAVTEHLRPRRLCGDADRRLLSELGWHHRQGNLLRFLDDPSIEPTNNRSERGLRPAVIARKVSHCSKTWPGARAHEALASVCCTLRQRGMLTVAALAEVFRTGRVPDPP